MKSQAVEIFFNGTGDGSKQYSVCIQGEKERQVEFLMSAFHLDFLGQALEKGYCSDMSMFYATPANYVPKLSTFQKVPKKDPMFGKHRRLLQKCQIARFSSHLSVFLFTIPEKFQKWSDHILELDDLVVAKLPFTSGEPFDTLL